MSGKVREKREKKKIIYKTIVTMHICTITVAILHINSVLDGLMWVVFEQKCVKLCKICNFFYFAWTVVISLTMSLMPMSDGT